MLKLERNSFPQIVTMLTEEIAKSTNKQTKIHSLLFLKNSFISVNHTHHKFD